MVDFAISCASSFVSKVAEYLVPPIGRQIGYIWNYNSNFDNLKEEIEMLKHKRRTVQHDVDAARGKGEEIDQHVSVWLDNVIKMIDEASTVVGEKEQGNTKCFKGLCPNPKKRYQYGRKAAKKLKAVAELHGKGNFTKVSYKIIPKEIWIPSHIGYEAFESRESTLKEVRKALEDANINTIGVHGSGGIGKTTLVKKVADYAENNKLFNVVAFAEVGEKPDIEKIQRKIAFSLGLEFNMEGRDERAMTLQARLKKEEKVLLVLDNIWERLSLDKVGIPFGDDHKGCKLLLTARDLNALTSTGSKHNFSMGILKDEEAWILFCTKVGDCVEKSDERKNLAKDIVKACGGLPIAIVTIAGALLNAEVFEWRNALRELTKPSSSFLEGVVGEIIKFSYDQLKGEELRAIFLLCCVMKSTYDASVRDLVMYAWGLGVLKSEDRIEDVRDHVRTLVQRLKDASLLLHTPDNESFSMHDVVRHVGRLIASRNQHVVNIGRDWCDDGALKTSTRIFLNNATELPEELRCPNLQLLCIDGTEGLKIPDNFFTGMPQIRVLHLFGFDVLSLPTSLCQLVDLRALCIDAIEVKDIALIGKLKKLEFLRIDDYGIERLPEEICELTRLRFLDVEGYSNVEVIPPNVISRLTQLEELYLGDNTFIPWEDQDGSNVLSKGLFSKTLERYHINIGGTAIQGSSDSNLESRKLQLSCFKDVHHKMQNVKKVVSALDGGEGFSNLKQLFVGDSSFFHTVVDCSELNSCDPFPYLETLILDELNNLETIYNRQLGAENLCHLVSIQVSNCAKLKNIFSFSTSRALPLQEIEVRNCANMTEIFAIGREEDIIQLKELCSLTLKALPQLTRFCSINNNEVIAEDKRDTPTPFFNATVVFPKLEWIEISDIDNLEMIWDNQLAKDSFNSLKSVTIRNCKSLKSLFRAFIANELLLLERLEVSQCGQLVEIVAKEEADIEAITGFDFPRLTSLILSGLPQLRHFYPGTANWPALNKLGMSDCQEISSLASEETNKEGQSNIPTLILFKKVTFPKLERIAIFDMDNLEMIWDNQLAKDSFNSLKSVTIRNCKSLKSLFPASIANELLLLERLEVSQCGQLVEIVAKEEADIEAITGFDFPRLTYLKLSGLPQLRHFYPGTANWPALNKLGMSDFQEIGSLASEETNKEGQSNIPTLILFQKVAFPKLEWIAISDIDNLEMIWDNQLAKDSFNNLKSVEIRNCQSLKSLFPTSIAKELSVLEELSVYECRQVVEIVAKEGADIEAVTRLDFPRLASLILSGLPQLRHFYPGTTNWPVLNKLGMSDCQEIGSLASKETNKECQSNIPALFFFKKGYFPNIEELYLGGENFRLISQAHFLEHLIPELKFLKVSHDKSAVFPPDILWRFLNLEKLQLKDSSYEEVFSLEEVQKHGEKLAQIKSLKLIQLGRLKHIGKQHSKLDFILQKLEKLKVSDCGLADLLPSSASFQSLKILRVENCHNLTSIFTSSTATSLVQLTDMKISDCNKLTKVVARDEEDITKYIIFHKLKSLTLDDLSSLTNFCIEEYDFEFPSLESLTVSTCSKMESFSPGCLSTPKLNTVRGVDIIWEGDIDTLIQQMYKKQSNSIYVHMSWW